MGATHGQLAARLEAAAPHRARPYASIEVFALSDAPLRELKVQGRSGDALISERNTALTKLAEYLEKHNVDHKIYLYSQPYVFASFWDAEDNETRTKLAPPAHIHRSHALWGSDLRSTPAIDLEAPAGEALPVEMQKCVNALADLRRVSSVWHSSATSD